ncbi:MAG: hypothetical protein HQL96_08625 [Magnetococcales bacterium]|nr:hypothetical protein [Magnetococcales bacterium]
MLQSVEAEIGEDGQIQLREPLTIHGPCRAVVIVLGPLAKEMANERISASSLGWRRHVGAMKDSPHFNGDPVAIQKAMRDEWG